MTWKTEGGRERSRVGTGRNLKEGEIVRTDRGHRGEGNSTGVMD